MRVDPGEMLRHACVTGRARPRTDARMIPCGSPVSAPTIALPPLPRAQFAIMRSRSVVSEATGDIHARHRASNAPLSRIHRAACECRLERFDGVTPVAADLVASMRSGVRPGRPCERHRPRVIGQRPTRQERGFAPRRFPSRRRRRHCTSRGRTLRAPPNRRAMIADKAQSRTCGSFEVHWDTVACTVVGDISGITFRGKWSDRSVREVVVRVGPVTWVIGAPSGGRRLRRRIGVFGATLRVSERDLGSSEP